MTSPDGVSENVQGPHRVPEDKARVLLVDDEAIIRSSLELLLKKAGYSVTTAKSGVKALDSLTGHHPDICLIDIQLSGMNGRELSLEILKRCPETKIILMTGYANINRDFTAEEARNFKILYKPVDIDLLFETLKQSCSENSG